MGIENLPNIGTKISYEKTGYKGLLKTTKAEEILNNYINGNISDFKEQIRKLSKGQLFDFVYYVKET
jgi:hypothetical protein